MRLAEREPCSAFFVDVHDQETVEAVLELLDAGWSYSGIAKKLDISRSVVGNFAAGKLPHSYVPRSKSEHLTIFATNKNKICRKHKCYMPCVACGAERYRDEHPEKEFADPVPSLYDDSHRRAVDELRREIDDKDDWLNEGRG